MNDIKIGILGGGQLGKMLCMAGSGMSLNISVMDKSKSFPAGLVCKNFIEGDITSEKDVLDFGRSVDVLTIEFEKINVDALYQLESEGKKVFPSASIIGMIQDKGTQKQFYSNHNIPTSDYYLCESKEDVLSRMEDGEFSFPFVQKTRRDGYDGQGVLVCKDESYKSKLFDAPCVIEKMVDIEKELAVIVCRNEKGDIAIFDTVEMVFDPQANLLDYQLAPARIDKSMVYEINDLAMSIAQKLDLVGLLAIELFLDTSGKILVNEMAPRPHNSGHHSIEACFTSQYENHLRAILNLPLGKTDILSPSILINLLGCENYSGKATISGSEDILKVQGSHLHLYGKNDTKPYRKMGHVTLLHEKEHVPYDSIDEIKRHFKTAP